MSFLTRAVVIAAALAQVSVALPSWAFQDFGLELPGSKRSTNLQARYDTFPDDLSQRLGGYQPPGPNDSRGPCPGLNTLANHGLINHDGRNLNSEDIKTAFSRGFGIAEDGIDLALHNYEVVCEYVRGVTCGVPENNGTFILTNLTLLGLPHAFEHDHSFSREDYKMNYGRGRVTDNIFFNATQMQTGLDVVGYKPSNPPTKALANYQQFNEMRLQRESLANQADYPGSFQVNAPIQLGEIGFIFGATFDRDSSGNMIGSDPMVRLDWWNFWFAEESFPTQLGWVPAHTAVFNGSFVASVSTRVMDASVTSTPKSLPPGALATTYSPVSNFPEAGPTTTNPLFVGTPYVAPTAPSAIRSEAPAKRDVNGILPIGSIPSSVLTEIAAEVTAAPNIIQSALSLVGPAPPKYNLYQTSINLDQLENQIAAAYSYESAVLAAVTSLAGL